MYDATWGVPTLLRKPYSPEYVEGEFCELPLYGVLRSSAWGQRGEVRLEAITPRVASLPTDLICHELLLTHAPVPEATIVEIVDDIFLPLVRARSESA
jgi:Tetracyclin repressor-like, C-terminal domain